MPVNRETWVSINRGSQPILSLFSGYWVFQYSVSSEVSLIASFSAFLPYGEYWPSGLTFS